MFPIPVWPLRWESRFVGLLCSCCEPESTSSLAKPLGIQPQISRWPLSMSMPTSLDTSLPDDASPRLDCQPELAPCSPLTHRSSKSGSHHAHSGTPLLKRTLPQWTGSSPRSVQHSLPRDSYSSAPPQSTFASPLEPLPAQPDWPKSLREPPEHELNFSRLLSQPVPKRCTRLTTRRVAPRLLESQRVEHPSVQFRAQRRFHCRHRLRPVRPKSRDTPRESRPLRMPVDLSGRAHRQVVAAKPLSLRLPIPNPLNPPQRVFVSRGWREESGSNVPDSSWIPCWISHASNSGAGRRFKTRRMY